MEKLLSEEDGAGEARLRLCGSLYGFWHAQKSNGEGLRRMVEAIAAAARERLEEADRAFECGAAMSPADAVRYARVCAT